MVDSTRFESPIQLKFIQSKCWPIPRAATTVPTARLTENSALQLEKVLKTEAATITKQNQWARSKMPCIRS